MKFFRIFLGGIVLAILVALVLAFLIPKLSGGPIMFILAIILLPFLYGLARR